MTTVLMLIFVVGVTVAIGLPVWRTLQRRRKEQALLENPPEMVCFRVRVPAETDKSNLKATHFFERLAAGLPNDDKLLESNQNVVHAAYIAKGAGVGRATQVYFLVWCHPEYADRVALTLQESYPDEAEITEAKVQDDPLRQYIETYRTRRDWERAQQAAAAPEDDDEDE